MRKIYKTQLNTDIWQLFVDGKMMTSARWPNAEAWSEEMWDLEKTWMHQDTNSIYGHFIDDGTLDLAGTGIDFTGAMAVMNVGSWETFAEHVTRHGAGNPDFTYTKNFPESNFRKVWEGRGFFECAMACLDAPNEWYYDKGIKILYLYPDDGKDPSGRKINGKVTTYALDVSGCSYIQFRDLNFFACTGRFLNTDHLLLENCNFNFPSYSKRMLGIIDKPDPTIILNRAGNPSENIIRNCIFKYADGSGIRIAGKNDIIENCSWHYIDYGCVGTVRDVLINAWEADGLTFRRNTMFTGGNSVGLKTGRGSLVELNRASRLGLLQHDGSALQASTENVEGTIMRQNWVYNSAKSGIRFDSPWREPDVYGSYGTIERNVIWNTRRIQPKGDDHWVYNNTAFDNERGDLSIFSDLEHGGVNKNTITRNNAINTLTGSNNKGEITLIHGIHDHNWVGRELGKDVKDQLRDPDNFDFRPKSGSELIDNGMVVMGVTDGYIGDAPDIGAYEFGVINYWIPGREMSEASFPIPLNGGKTHTSLVDLIWLEGYRTESHDVFFGSSKDAVENASRSSATFKGNQTCNIFNPGYLEAGKTYYWRIDALRDSVIVKGEVWNFTAVIDAN